MTRIYLIRHAEAEGNLYRRIHGQYNSLITNNGYRQIKALEERFRDIHIDAVYSSDLFRTMTTAQAITVPKGLPLITRPDLREINMGDWEDHTFAYISRRDKELMKQFSTTSPLFRAPRGESFLELSQRGVSAIRSIAAMHDGQTVAVFAHGTLIRNTVAAIMGQSLEEAAKSGHSDNTAVTLLEVENGKTTVVFANDNSHLTPEISTLARQHWWNKNSDKVDINLWFQYADLTKEEDRAFFMACREESWRSLYGKLDDHFDGRALLAEAEAAQQRYRKSVAIAMDGRKRAGLLQIDPALGTEDRQGHVSFLYVLPDSRGDGLGVQVLGKAVSTFRNLDREVLLWSCDEGNKPALDFSQKYGFQVTGTVAGTQGGLYRMEKPIGYENQGELLL